jgi:RNA polymerase sigma factor (sigma-70 family)
MMLKKDWVLNREAFEALLVSLDPDPARAGDRYEQLRQALITFFECRGGSMPEELSDDTMNRVARRLSEGQRIEVENPASYFYGVARNVLREHWEARSRAPEPLENQPAAPRSPDPHSLREQRSERLLKERRLDALERCLDTLAANEQELIRLYYQGEAGVRIQARRHLAGRLGIAVNALRIRALRIRVKLEACVEGRLGAAAPNRNAFPESP